MTTYAIQTENLVKTYGHGRSATHAINGLSLNVPEGSIYGLLGRNSAGKSTTIRMAMGLARPSSGTMRVFGLNPAVDPERVTVLNQVGFVPEDKALIGSSPRKIFELNRSFYPSTWSDSLARKLIARLELPLDKAWAALSLGNKTKAALICAIAQRSRLLILDEPTTGLDPVVLDELLRILVEDCTAPIANDQPRTILLSSHQLAEIEQIADHIGIMDRGRLLLEGPLDEIRARFLRVTVTGENLPRISPSILSVKRELHATQYVLQRDPELFLSDLRSQGATVAETMPLSLNEIFLELCRTHDHAEDTVDFGAAR